MVDIDAMKTLLEQRRAELDVRLHKLEVSLDAPAPKDREDCASERQGDEVKEDLGLAGLTEIRQIDAALKRIANGEFGICVNCGAEISEARLLAVPHATRCRRCA
ncbi:MAG: TraR/DksA family transcriptional regulator [Pseudomonadota bacterium]